MDRVVAKRTTAKKGFILPPRHWVDEHRFTRVARFRRLVRDYERFVDALARLHLVAFVYFMFRQAATMLCKVNNIF
ncbi:MAG TPA: hypothetical protein VJ577_00890 [Burkholderiaceae bacterium]|nr:hypothetical protein [Burkholderiaceae bacterium]